MGADTQKRNRRQQAWIDKNRDRINIAFPKGLKDQVQSAADAAGLSKSAWITAAIKEKLDRQ